MLGILKRESRGAAGIVAAGAAFLCLLGILPALSGDSLATLDNTPDEIAAALPALAPRCPVPPSNGRSPATAVDKLSPPESSPLLPSRAPPRA
jgi:hypothetical protein